VHHFQCTVAKSQHHAQLAKEANKGISMVPAGNQGAVWPKRTASN
jgi:hypothetical protein